MLLYIMYLLYALHLAELDAQARDAIDLIIIALGAQM